MAIVSSGSIAILDDSLQAGRTSIALEVAGNVTPPKSLAALGGTAGKTAGGTAMTEFYGYTALTIPNSPSGAGAFEGLGIEVDWIDNSSNEDGFRIERSVNSGSWLFRTNASANSTFWSDGNLFDAGDQIQYRIRAYNAAGSSGWAYTNTVNYSGGVNEK